jgi:hypothetical protein
MQLKQAGMEVSLGHVMVRTRPNEMRDVHYGFTHLGNPTTAASR